MGEPSSENWTTGDLPAPRNINQRELSQKSLSQCKDPAPPNGQQAPVLDVQYQSTNKTRTHSYPLEDRLPNIILSSQTPQNTPPDAALPTKMTRSSPTYQNTGSSPLHRINPRRGYNNCKYLCTKHRSTSIHKANANSHKRGNRQ